MSDVDSPTADADGAPVFEIPDRDIIALEHPMVIQNLDNAVKTFGTNRPFLRILDSADPEQCIPLYLRHNDPMCVPILSHNSPTNNVLLQITVPKRTGGKRKRGSDGPFFYPSGEDVAPMAGSNISDAALRSQHGLDKPSVLFRKLRDNPDTYSIEAVGDIRQTHRYRGVADFHHSTTHNDFAPRFRDQLLSGDIEKMREFKFNPGRGWKPNEEFIPAPKMTNHAIPQNWGWHQNSNIFRQVESKTGEDILVNRSKPEKFLISYLRFNVESVPQASPFEPPDDPRVQEIVAELNEAFKERPIWSRRALLNHLSNSPVIHLVKAGIQHIGYQFKGGPFRECVIRYGLDPRTDPTCRKYQTIFFKIYEDQRNSGMQWHDIRTTYSLTKKGGKKGPNDGHLFDGKKVTLDGKLWQLCDISDPLLASLIESSPYSTTFEIKADGWYPNGSMAKIRSIMRAKIQAIRQKKILLDGDFARALEVPDEIPGRKSAQIQVPIPDDGLTAEELEKLKQKGEASVIEENGIRRRIHKGKMRSERIRSRVGVRKEERRTRTSRGTQADAKPTAKYLRELHDEADNSNGMSVVDPRLFAAGADALIGEDGSHGSAGLQADKDDNSTDDGDEEQESDAVEDGDEDEEDEEDNDEEDDEDGLEDIPAPTLRAGDTGSRPTGSAKFAMAKSKSDHSKATHGSPASGTSSVNGLRYTPAPVDLSTFRNIAPRPPPP